MTGRILDQARREQGFRSQAHLDSFYRLMDHKAGCAICSHVGGVMPLDDGMQPYMDQCAEGERLTLLSWAPDQREVGS